MLMRKLMARLQSQADDGADLGGEDGIARAENGDAIGTGNNARIAMLERINDANDQFRADELANVNDDGSTEDFVANALTPSDDDGVTEQEIKRMEDEVNDPVQERPEQPQLITRKVNGRDLTLPLEEWLARASKIEAADQYLSEAARRLRATEQQPNPAMQQPPDQGVVAGFSQEDLRAQVRALQMGSEDEAAAALVQIIQKASGPQLTPTELARTVDERVAFKEAISAFNEEYSDVLADPNLRQMALARDQALMAAGDRRPYLVRYREIGNEIRGWRNQLIQSAAPQQSQPTPTDNRAVAKAAAAQRSAPKANSVKAPVATRQEEKEDSVSDVIASIARARGGPQWSRA